MYHQKLLGRPKHVPLTLSRLGFLSNDNLGRQNTPLAKCFSSYAVKLKFGRDQVFNLIEHQ